MSASPAPGGRAVFGFRDFRLFCIARLLSGTAQQMQNVALGWFVYDLTHSALALGLVGLASFAPALALALVTGHVADAFDRRAIVAAAHAATALSSAGLLAVALADSGLDPGAATVWPVYALAVLAGAARAFGNPAGQALLPTLVPRELFGGAIAWSTSFWQSASIAGPALGGLLYALGPSAVFAATMIAFGSASLLIAGIATRAAARAAARPDWASLLAGVAFIRSRPVVLGAISLDLAAVLLGGATALLPIFAQDVLGVGPLGLGILRSAPAIGAVATALLLAQRPLARRIGPRMLAAAALFGLATAGFGLSRHFALSFALLCVTGAADMVSVYVRQTLVQMETPDAMRGRVAAVNTIFIGASNELGEFESGALAALVGAVPAVVAGGLATTLVALLWGRLFPALRARDRFETEACSGADAA